MKKILLFIICLFILPVCVSAEKYTISELDLSIDIPDNYLVITTDNYKNNQKMEDLGVTPEYMEQVFENYNAYLDAFDMSTGKEIFIIVNPVSGDYSNYSKEALEELIPVLEKQYVSLGGESINVSIVNINGTNYFMIDYYQGGYYLVNYYLVYQNKGYNFQIQSKSVLTDSDKANYRKIVETVKYNVGEEEIPPVIDDEETEKDNTEKDDNGLIIICVSVAIFIGAVIGLVVISTKKKNNKCSKCGINLNENIMFCPNCGTKK